VKLTADWHIHSHNSCDCHGRGMTVREIIEGAAAAGVTDFGVADHLHSRYNLPDIAAARVEFVASDPPPRGHFGVEVTCMRQWELDEIASGRYDEPAWGIGQTGPDGPLAIDLTEDDVAGHGIEFVIGAVHWARGVPQTRESIIENYLRQYLFLAEHPLVDIIAHPWWWCSGFQNDDGSFSGLPWFDDFDAIPESVRDEFAAALIEHDTAAEINPGVVITWHYPERWRQRYIEYLAELAERGVRLVTGSDRHLRPYENRFEEMAPLLQKVGINDEAFWRLPPRADD